MLDTQLGERPIHEDRPAGTNPREGESFALLEAELNKLTDLHARTAPDWQRVAEFAIRILRDEGKDLNAAVWLTLAWTHARKTSGLAAGIRVLRDVHLHYWDEMTPPPARLRGRRNQMEWLLEQLDQILAEADQAWTCETFDQHEDMLADWDALDTFWQEHDDQAPALFRLRRALQGLAPVEQDEPESGLAQTRHEAGSTHSGHESEQPDGTALEGGATPGSAAADQPAAAQAPAGPAAAQAPDESAAPAAQPAANAQPVARTQPAVDAPDAVAHVLQTTEEVERIIEEGLDRIYAALHDVPDDLMALPMLYRFNRMRAWLTLTGMPSADDGISRIPAPPPADQDGLQRLVDAGDPLAILRFTESRLFAHRFWLDLHRVAHEAAQALPGGHEVAAVIASDVSHLLQRMPGLPTLSFVSGQPFADPSTQAWLTTLAVAEEAGSGRARDHRETIGHLDEAASSRKETADWRNEAAVVPAASLGLLTLLAAATAETQAAARMLETVAQRLQAGTEQLIQ